MLPSQDMQYLAIATIDIHSHLSKRSENILEEHKSRLMDLRCKSDLNVMFVYWCRLFNASIASVLGMAAMAIHLLTCPQKSEYVHQSNLLVFSWVLVFWSRPQPRPVLSLAQSGPELLMKITLLQSRESCRAREERPKCANDQNRQRGVLGEYSTHQELRLVWWNYSKQFSSLFSCICICYRQCRGFWICDGRVPVWHKA